MTTFADMNALASIQDFSADLIAELIGDYCVRGKQIDPKTEDPMKLLGRVDWLVNRIGRALKVAGKLDPAKASFRIDRDADNLVSVRFVDLKGKTLYTLRLGEKGKGGADFEYILEDASGTEIVRNHKWGAIAAYFAPEKEVAVKKAAAPKKPKAKPAKKDAAKKPAKKAKAKAVKAVKSPVPAAPAETDVAQEVDAAIAEFEEDPPAELG